MTAVPLQPPRLLTAAEFAGTPETPNGWYELLEGHIFMCVHPTPEHQLCMMELGRQLRDQVPDHLRVVPSVAVDLQIVPADQPGFVRIPDLAFVTQAGLDRRRRDGGLLRADEVVVVVEIVSSGTERTDRRVKHDEYADAGIPHYWVVDIADRPALTTCYLTGEFGYADAPEVTGAFTTDEPFPIRLDLDRLT